MPELPRISEAEWDVMHVIWEDPPLTAHEVAERLEPDREWSIRTVKTLLGRLVKKGVLTFELDGKRYLYHPALTREECVREEGRSFLRRVHKGSLSPLLAFFVHEGKLTKAEREELKALLERKRGRE